MLLGYPGDAVEMKRQMLNAWIRGSGTYDIVLDFDAVLRDPGMKQSCRPGSNTATAAKNSPKFRNPGPLPAVNLRARSTQKMCGANVSKGHMAATSPNFSD